MGLNWKGFAKTALEGVGGQMTVNYNAEQQSLRRMKENEMSINTQMNKQKQMETWKTEQASAQKNKAAEEAGLTKGTPEFNEFVLGVKPNAEQQGTLASQQKDAAVREGLKNANIQENTPEWDKMYKEQMGLTKPDTAAQISEARVTEIYDGLADDGKGGKVMTPKARMLLATHGVKVGGEPVPLTGAVRKDLLKMAQEEAIKTHSPEILDDNAAINMANANLPPNKQVANAKAAREYLIENDTFRRYMINTAYVSGASDTSFKGKEVPPEVSTKIVQDNEPVVDQFDPSADQKSNQGSALQGPQFGEGGEYKGSKKTWYDDKDLTPETIPETIKFGRTGRKRAGGFGTPKQAPWIK